MKRLQPEGVETSKSFLPVSKCFHFPAYNPHRFFVPVFDPPGLHALGDLQPESLRSPVPPSEPDGGDRSAGDVLHHASLLASIKSRSRFMCACFQMLDNSIALSGVRATRLRIGLSLVQRGSRIRMILEKSLGFLLDDHLSRSAWWRCHVQDFQARNKPVLAYREYPNCLPRPIRFEDEARVVTCLREVNDTGD